MKLCIHVRPRDDGQGWAIDVYDGRRAWTKTHLGESPLNKAEAHRLAHKLRDPKFYTARTKRGRGRTSGDKSIPLVPLRDIIIFPHMVSQLFVGREKSIAALDEAMSRDKSKEIFLAAQRHAKTNEPGFDDIFTVGAVGVIMQLLRLPDGTVRVTVEGRRRARIKRFIQTDPFFAVDWEEIPEVVEQGVEIEALMRSVASTFGEYGKLNNKKIGPELVVSVQAIDDPARLSDTVIANLPTVKLSDRQGLLETPDARARLERLMELMQAEIEILQGTL
jgi:ATP-dependent Lon protease